MGKKPDERELRRKGAELLHELRRQPRPKVALTREQRDGLLRDLGTTTERVDELMSMEVTT